MLRRLPTSAVLLGVPVLACLVLRCEDLNRQVFSYNETATSIYTAGYSYAEVGSRLHEAGLVSASDILRFQRLTDRSFGSTARSLREEDPQHPPLYFALMRLWLRAFPGGAVPVVTRAFSVVFSLATLLPVFWLARELFTARSTAWTILAVVSVSPFNFVYARHARSYALLTLWIVLSSALLLWSRRKGGFARRALYGLSLCGGMYTHFLFGLVIAAHGAYCVAMHRLERRGTVRPFVAACGLAAVSVIPWLYYSSASQNIRETVVGELTTRQLFSTWAVLGMRVFVDFDTVAHPRAAFTAVVLALGLVATALAHLGRRLPEGRSVFILALVLVPTIPLMVLDVAVGGVHSSGGPIGMSTQGRYMLPTLIGLQFAVGALLDALLTGPPSTALRYSARLAVVGAVILSGILGCAEAWHAPLWWQNPGASREAVAVLNASGAPLVVADVDQVRRLSSLSYGVSPSARFLVLARGQPFQVPGGFSPVYLLPSPAMDKMLRSEGCRFERVRPVGDELWRLGRCERP